MSPKEKFKKKASTVRLALRILDPLWRAGEEPATTEEKLAEALVDMAGPCLSQYGDEARAHPIYWWTRPADYHRVKNFSRTVL